MANDQERGELGMPTLGSPARMPYSEEGAIVRLPRNVPISTPEASRIISDIGDWLGRFLRKNAKYARAQDIDLGAKGIIPDINRKTSVLIDRIWYGAEEVDEPTIEVVDDLLGHLMLLRDKLVTGSERR